MSIPFPEALFLILLMLMFSCVNLLFSYNVVGSGIVPTLIVTYTYVMCCLYVMLLCTKLYLSVQFTNFVIIQNSLMFFYFYSFSLAVLVAEFPPNHLIKKNLFASLIVSSVPAMHLFQAY